MSTLDGQSFHTNQTHYLRAEVTFDASGVVSLGWVPHLAVVTAAAATVTEAFDAGTTNTVDIGFRNAGDSTADDANEFASAIAVGSVGRKAADELNTAGDLFFPKGAEIIATYNQTGTAPTAGSMIVHVEYLVDNSDVDETTAT